MTTFDRIRGMLWLMPYPLLLLVSAINDGASISIPPEHSLDNQNHSLQLPLGDVNILVVTDVHSWVGGHNPEHEPYLNVDYGTVLSFYETLQKRIDGMNDDDDDGGGSNNKDLFFVMNGDFMDGTGLSLQMDRLFPILERMPFSAVNLGNHELYFEERLVEMRDKGFIDHWKGNYLTSNTLWTDTQLPIGNRFTYLKSQHSQKHILVFGFLYNFQGACAVATVERVQDVVQQQWFMDVLTFNSSNVKDNGSKANQKASGGGARVDEEDDDKAAYKEYDAILVLAHMGYKDPLIDLIRRAIRNITEDYGLPIQFIAGHTHTRGYDVLDEMSTTFQPGRFLDTIGFVSFPWQNGEAKHDDGGGGEPGNTTIAVVDDSNKTSTEAQFSHVFLDANKYVLKETLDGGHNGRNHSDFTTAHGHALSRFIEQTREAMGLTEVIGCSGGHYRLDLPLDDPRSLWGLYVREVIPHALGNNHSRMFIQRTRSLRYDLLVGPITVDDAIAVSPMNDRMIRILESVDMDNLLLLLNKLDVSGMDELRPNLPRYGVAPLSQPIHLHEVDSFELYGMEADWPSTQTALAELALADNESFFSMTSWEHYEPKLYRGGPDGTEIQRSHGVWVHFVEDNWKCVGLENNPDFKFNKQLWIWLCALTALMGLAHYFAWLSSDDRISTDQSRVYVRMAGVSVHRNTLLKAKSARRQQQQQHNHNQTLEHHQQQQHRDKNGSQPTEFTSILYSDGQSKTPNYTDEPRS